MSLEAFIFGPVPYKKYIDHPCRTTPPHIRDRSVKHHLSIVMTIDRSVKHHLSIVMTISSCNVTNLTRKLTWPDIRSGIKS
ncbi:hypothetical protein X798_06334 [Onchocerca flexuosa]|uniref:Uncharacterized protein n=1 Tax=Onchocerca flexuosa TaxID=387005 RepID=A0A238BQ17_9BILA|nr:hypothetical protein X798_06334 [Onchocerca flexuosa]